jgi:hypothetical protein
MGAYMYAYTHTQAYTHTHTHTRHTHAHTHRGRSLDRGCHSTGVYMYAYTHTHTHTHTHTPWQVIGPWLSQYGRNMQNLMQGLRMSMLETVCKSPGIKQDVLLGAPKPQFHVYVLHIYVCMYIYIYIYTHIHTNVCISPYMYVCVYIHTYASVVCKSQVPRCPAPRAPCTLTCELCLLATKSHMLSKMCASTICVCVSVCAKTGCHDYGARMHQDVCKMCASTYASWEFACTQELFQLFSL